MNEVPAAFVQVPFVITFDAARFEATYDFPTDDGDDPRFNLSKPMGLPDKPRYMVVRREDLAMELR